MWNVKLTQGAAWKRFSSYKNLEEGVNTDIKAQVQHVCLAW